MELSDDLKDTIREYPILQNVTRMLTAPMEESAIILGIHITVIVHQTTSLTRTETAHRSNLNFLNFRLFAMILLNFLICSSHLGNLS
jgi:hypothetical protein